MALQPVVQPAADRPIAEVEVWVDGRGVAKGPPGTPLALETASFDDGWHEVRFVAVESSPVATRSAARSPRWPNVRVGNILSRQLRIAAIMRMVAARLVKVGFKSRRSKDVASPR